VSASIIIADVGHGNSALVCDDKFTVLIDAAPGGIPEALLRDAGLKTVDHVIISHADRDHIGGLPSVLRQFKVTNVWINGDVGRAGRTWDAVRGAVWLAEQKNGTVVRNAVAHGTDIASPSGRVEVKVLAPTGGGMLWGAGAAPPGQAKQTANSLSAVVAVFIDGASQALLAGDAGAQALSIMEARGADLRAPILAFPHHGGRPGSDDPVRVARAYTTAVDPKHVIFSVGRSRAGFPRVDVVDAVRSQKPTIHVACTQLNVNCSASTPPVLPTHLSDLAAGGRASHACCAGTIHHRFDDGAASVGHPEEAAHSSFVSSLHGTPICHRPVAVALTGAPQVEAP
jgi:beta-lactamase superfamily II metal-dependent hydrolase